MGAFQRSKNVRYSLGRSRDMAVRRILGPRRFLNYSLGVETEFLGYETIIPIFKTVEVKNFFVEKLPFCLRGIIKRLAKLIKCLATNN